MLENSYWNIDSILHGMTKKECKLNYDLDFLKDLFPGQENNNQFNKNEIIKLPLTLALTLSNPPDDKKYITMQTPNTLSDEYYALLIADPIVPNFNKNKYYYDEYLLLKNNLSIDEKKWNNCIINTNFNRYLYYYNNSFNIKSINNTVEKKTSKKEQIFFNNMVNINNNNKYFQENYCNNNKILDEKIEAKKNRHKIKLINSNL